MRAVFVSVLSLTAAAALGDVRWNEFVDGDISSDPNAPTPLTFGLGGNTIIGSVLGPDDRRDYVTFDVPAGMALAALYQHQYVDLDTGGPGNWGFHAINAGNTSWIPDPTTVDFFLGSNHMFQEVPGTDVLPQLAEIPFGGIGFDIPLGPGTYTYLIQQTGPDNTGYTLEFWLIPTPPTAALIGIALMGTLRRRR
ncbi:MAG: hypothetical protein KIS87_11730 [Phycisphaeraceae bacterium]|nr:hypothetical protein [Phycisphaeraceae bacterium]